MGMRSQNTAQHQCSSSRACNRRCCFIHKFSFERDALKVYAGGRSKDATRGSWPY